MKNDYIFRIKVSIFVQMIGFIEICKMFNLDGYLINTIYHHSLQNSNEGTDKCTDPRDRSHQDSDADR